MASYRLIRLILSESKNQRNHSSLDESEFIFTCRLFKDPARARSELAELERCGFIRYTEPGRFVPTYRAYHWRRLLLAQILRYIGFSIVTPILVTLLTMWLTGVLQPPA